ncbi:hypothetical protein ACHAW6_008385, partial [Cyclotella cf. meneghiniana]
QAVSGRYSYTVALSSNGFQFCGGSLIAPDVVLTAAHCIDGSSFSVVVGRHDLTTSSGEVIARKKAIKHPNYNTKSMVNDFAIVLLSKATTQNVQFVKLNKDEAYPVAGANSRTMGWGDTTQGGSGSNVLREVDLPVITNELCYEKYPGDIYASMICTFLPGKDSCQGDSGGPLIIPGSSADTDTLIGMVSWGIGCASSKYPGVYSRVSNGYDWIKTNVCSMSSSPPSYLCALTGNTNPPTVNNPTTGPPTHSKPTTSPSTNNKPTTKPPTNKPTIKPPTNKPTKSPRTSKPTKSSRDNRPTQVSYSLIALPPLSAFETFLVIHAIHFLPSLFQSSTALRFQLW